MPFNVTPDVHVRKDEAGRVRYLSHVDQPYTAAQGIKLASAAVVAPEDAAVDAVAPRPPSMRALADQYVREVSGLFDLAPHEVSNLSASPSFIPDAAPSELRFREEKEVANSGTVSYDQTYLGLPVWNAGVTVRINAQNMEVVGAHNEVHYGIDAAAPPPDARYLPHRLGEEALAALLGMADQAEHPRVLATRLLVHQYHAGDRIDVHSATADESSGFAGNASPNFPELPLPPVDGKIGEGQHYVVTEALFELRSEGWGKLNWRALVEPVTGSVLYVRPLVSCASAAVFATDPVTATGVAHTAATNPDVLDSIRRTLDLPGLVPPSNDRQQLSGEFIQVKNEEIPDYPMPDEASPFEFVYSCPTERFAAASAYYHCDWVFRMIQGMGIPIKSYFNNTLFPVPVDPHALGGQVNAQARGNAAGNGMGAFVFGVAQAGQSMGIAADVRVVLHEFGHALLWDHVNSPNFGFAHSAGDSLACILHDPETKCTDPHDTFPFMNASSRLSRRHDREVGKGWAWFGPMWDPQYRGEQILSTTMFRIYRACGGASNDPVVKRRASRYVVYLIIKACGMLSFMSRDPVVFVQALTEADATTLVFEGQPGGALRKVIRWSFEKQGLFQPAGAPVPVMREGDAPSIDVYIDDGRAGEYTPGAVDVGQTPGVWNRQTADAGTVHQAPVVGVNNYAYGVVRNRGTQNAETVVVSAYQARVPNPIAWPADWVRVTQAPAAVNSPIAPKAGVPFGPIEWVPSFTGQQLLVVASAPGDISCAETVTAGPIDSTLLIDLDNNMARRAM